MANGHISDIFADNILAGVFTANWNLPQGCNVGLTLELPSDVNGTGIVVPDAPEYGPVWMPFDDYSTWASMGAGSRSIESAIDVVFEPATVDWGQILGYTLHDSYGVYLGYGITNPYLIKTGMTARLPAGLIVITMPI
jgi:hypothetical protein